MAVGYKSGAVLVGTIVKAPHSIHTQVRQVVAQLVEILLCQLFVLFGIRAASHAGIVAWRMKGEYVGAINSHGK
jgi:hypothetical protein